MKKTLTVIAALAIAASAQATLLASWGALGVADEDADTAGLMEGYKILDADSLALGVTDMSAYNGASLGTGSGQGNTYDIRLGTLSKDGGAGLQFGYKVLEDTEIANATISGDTHVTAAGPEQMDWFVDDPTGTAKASIVSTGTAVQTGGSWNLGTLSGEGKIYLIANLTAGRTGTATGAVSGNFDFANLSDSKKVELNGTVQDASAVPEPATMSLLGLGALAMVIRRKMGK